MIGIPYENRYLSTLPIMCEPDPDCKAYGIRDKNARYREYVAKIMNMTADAIGWHDDIYDLIGNKDMPKTVIEQYAQSSGWAAVIKAKDGSYHYVSGVCAGFIGEWTEYFMPRGIIVSNPYATGIDGQYYFGENAVLLRNDTAMQGLFPIICPRAEMEIENNISILLGLNNLRVINIIHAIGDNMAEAARSFFRQIRWGRFGIITGKDSKNKWSGSLSDPVIENLPTGGVPANYMIQFIETAQFIRGSLYNDIGLQYNSNMKRESLNAAETTMNDDALHPIIDNMMECRKRFCEDMKTVFGVEIMPPELKGAWKKRKEESEKAETKQEEPAKTESEQSEKEVSGNEEMQNAYAD